ncbi:MAG: tetratricopeptide repeat protein [Planctomycetes bacterium]|nr:tetratricopeptide repeat protein [Planctomycetota bacterium]
MSEPRGKILTFYSFKGGVGRSMAVANVAWRLAEQHGLHVLVVDWDLEAPGLDRFFQTSPPEAGGLVDYLEADLSGENPSLVDYLVIPDRAPSQGVLEVLLAGRLDADYGPKLDRLRRLFENPSDRWAVAWLSEELASHADLILIDSRTGLNDIGGVCTLDLPDGVVFLTSPNEQGYQGVEKVARAVRDQGTQTPTWLVVSRIPVVEEAALASEWWEAHQEVFEAAATEGVWAKPQHPEGIRSHWLPHRSRWAFGEGILYRDVSQEEPDVLRDRYDELAGALAGWLRHTRHPPEGIEALGLEIEAAEKRADSAGLSGALYELGVQQRKRGDLHAARQALERSLAIDLTLRDELGAAVTQQALAVVCLDQGVYEEAESLLEESRATATRIGDQRLAGIALGTLGQLAALRNRPKTAISHYSGALKTLKEIGDTRSQAVTLNALGQLLGESDPERARESFERASQLLEGLGDPHEQANSFVGLGYLDSQAGRFLEAKDYFERALSRREDPSRARARALTGRGVALANLRDRERGEQDLQAAANLSQKLGDVQSEIQALQAMVDLRYPQRAYLEGRIAILESSSVQAQVQNFIQHMHGFTQSLVQIDKTTGQPLFLSEPGHEGTLASGCFVEKKDGELSLYTANHTVKEGEWAWETGIRLGTDGSLLLPIPSRRVVDSARDFAQIPMSLEQLRDARRSFPELEEVPFQVPIYRGPLGLPRKDQLYGFAAANNARLIQQRERYLVRDYSYEIGMTFEGVDADSGLYRFRLARKHQGDNYYAGASGAPIADQEGQIVALVSSGDARAGIIFGIPLVPVTEPDPPPSAA